MKMNLVAKPNAIEKILMKRDECSWEDAHDTYLACKESVEQAIQDNDLMAAEDAIMGDLGLEPDYLEYFLFC